MSTTTGQSSKENQEICALDLFERFSGLLTTMNPELGLEVVSYRAYNATSLETESAQLKFVDDSGRVINISVSIETDL